MLTKNQDVNKVSMHPSEGGLVSLGGIASITTRESHILNLNNNHDNLNNEFKQEDPHFDWF
jgi:hypothetical protein